MNTQRIQGNLQCPTEFPKHTTMELFEMTEKLNKEYTCPICFDLTTKETIYITWCGHILCIKKRNKTDTKCPICRKNI